jgi:lon-related putative ATP-dependent protease
MASVLLSVDELYKTCEKDLMPFKTTSELTPLDVPLGQEKALAAIDFGINVDFDGYNIFCIGPDGTGKQSLVRQQIADITKDKPTPDDWCYVNNFEEPHKPKAIRLPAGKAAVFAKDIEKLLEGLRTFLPSVFEGEEYRLRLKAIESRYSSQKDKFYNELQFKYKGRKACILRMPVGLVVAPTKDGEVITPEAFDKLEDKEKEEILADLNEMQAELAEAVRDIPKWERKMHEDTDKLNESITSNALNNIMFSLKRKYKGHKAISEYLKEMQKDIIKNVSLFIAREEGGSEDNPDDLQSLKIRSSAARLSDTPLRRYCVNVLVKHDKSSGVPVIFCNNFTLPNLVGRMERLQQSGSVIMDFNLLKAGALHEANGGFLIIDAKSLLTNPQGWEALRRCLNSKKIEIETPSDDSNIVTTVILNPEPVDLDVKVILLGDSFIYNTLIDNNFDFSSLFKVSAYFTSIMDRNPENINLYARLIADLVRSKNLRALNRPAVAKVIEYASRLADDSEKLTTHISLISDLLKEANYFAKVNNSKTIGKNHIVQALEAKDKRCDQFRDITTEQIRRNIIMIQTEGSAVGQINGLAVYDIANSRFGKPCRITCQVRIGKGDVIDIEREVDLGGPTHTKGVLILSSFLSSRFAKDVPLSLEASLVFEQSYGEVDGDSASSTELYALISAITEVPIRQDLAVTGSVNQFGKVQAIGGVNEKIEGFFAICKMRGLTGTQGVIIPKSNVPHLMLNDEVLEAVKDGLFCIYAIDTIDDGLELLTGLPAGKEDEDGNYPLGSINRKVQTKLKNMYQKYMGKTREDNHG